MVKKKAGISRPLQAPHRSHFPAIAARWQALVRHQCCAPLVGIGVARFPLSDMDDVSSGSELGARGDFR